MSLTSKRLSFSLIIPTWNRLEQLTNCLCAISRLEYPRDDFEVIVADDASDTPIEAACAALPRDLNVSILRQARSGPAAARNAAAKRARGKFLAFTDDDCTPSPGWLSAFGAQLSASPEMAFGGRTLNALPGNRYAIVSQMLIDYLYKYYNSIADRSRFFTTNNFAVSREPFLSMGGFDTSFPRTGEDRNFCDQWVFLGRKLTYAPEAIVYHAHPMTFGAFLRQHWQYGRDAYHYHEVYARRHRTQVRIEPLRFYFDLARYPLKEIPLPRVAPVMLLMALTQIANAEGFMHEWARRKAFHSRDNSSG
jgi:glycosyltransferase involved in cell wall biosynthesis